MRLRKLITRSSLCSEILIKFYINLAITASLLTTCAFQTFEKERNHLNSSFVINNTSKHKLKPCSTVDSSLASLAKTDTILILTFSPQQQDYMLLEYYLDWNNPLETCLTGENLNPDLVTTYSKADFDFHSSEIETNEREDFVFGVLRNEITFSDNGYLTVGDSNGTAEYYSLDEFCVHAVHGEGSNTTVDLKTCPFSKARPRLPKCCPFGTMLYNNQCIESSRKWDPGYMDVNSWKVLQIEKVDPIYTFPTLPCIEYESWEADNCTFLFHPVSENQIAFIGASRTWEILETKDWCIDTVISDEHERVIIYCCVKNETIQPETTGVSVVYVVSMYTGAGFHLLTTLVHLITWKKQNIHGKTLCSCTASLFFMQISLGTAHVLGLLLTAKDDMKIGCIANSISGQYFMVAAFTWLLVYNYDLWKTFKGIRVNGEGDAKKRKRFIIYSCFGWLFPLLISGISIALNFTFRCRISGILVPDYGEHYCFVAPWAQGPYIYYILGLLIAISYIFAVLTLIGFCQIKKGTGILRSNKLADSKKTIFLFSKLGVVMGFSWIFEVISWVASKENDNNFCWIILDLYNALSAILIFKFFVCKRTILKMLRESVPLISGKIF